MAINKYQHPFGDPLPVKNVSVSDGDLNAKTISVTGISSISGVKVTPVGIGATIGGIGVTYYGDGIQFSRTPDNYLFNVSIDNSTSTTLTGIGTTVLNLSVTPGKKYIIHSINASNVSAANTELNVIGAFDFSGGERSYFAYNIPIPTGTSIELLKQPQVLNPGDKILMRSTDYNRAGIDTFVQVYVTYQEKITSEYFGVGLGTVGIANTLLNTVYTSTSYPSVVQSIRMVNRTDSGPYPISVSITSGLTTTYLVDNLIIPKYGSVELVESPKRLKAGDIIKVDVDQTSTIDVQVSGRIVV